MNLLEADELWDNAKVNQSTQRRLEKIQEEAIQVVAMVIRLIIDCC